MSLPLHTAPAPVHCHDTLPQFQHWRLSRLRPPRAVAAFPTPPALAHAFTPLRRQGAGTHFTAVFACPRCSIGSIPPHLAAASHPAAGRTTAAAAQCIARGPTPDTGILQDTAGYCWILAISDADTGILGGAGGPSSAQYCSIITWRLALRYWDTSPAWIDYCDTHRVRHHEYRSIRGTSSEY